MATGGQRRPNTPHTWQYGGFPSDAPLHSPPPQAAPPVRQSRPGTAPARSNPNPLPAPSKATAPLNSSGIPQPLPDRSGQSALHLGSASALSSGDCAGFTHRLDCDCDKRAFSVSKDASGVWVAECPMADERRFCVSPERTAWLDRAAAFVDDALRNGGTVFVHCAHGVSASPTFLLCYLMHRRMGLLEACTLLKAKRVNVSPSDAYVELLFEQEERRFRLRSSREAVAATLRRKWLDDVRLGTIELSQANRIL
mmetsp:Transcript_6153/g.16089  ORF Transcript_6153/g.16089 Transcript_6153/m.16089 type:complete len:254 (-) Transcript_6153:122-883(-)|eukprot:3189094-Prymnesium_polylepis.1